ncbi:MAG: alpha-L-fucosidase [Armatimonadota bacterium]|nr:alpha-L-fucosidase [bacterium]MDW8322143.1 alpha-L-fucosidase [Armatimonadota bacterium]
MPEETPEQREQRLKWFREARFGMFIHWGLYSQLGRHEWVMNRERIPLQEYEKLADTWKPKPYPARWWARLAKLAGMRYMVMTTKHHEGFCLFDTQYTNYNAVKRGPGRDLVAEFVEAARAEGLKVGFYYSLMDWHHPDGARCKYDEAARKRFVEFTHGIVRELMTNYGKIDIMWYDVNWPLTPEEWEAEKMNRMVRELQPHIVINNRSGLPEDFGTPEQHITPEKGGRMWEACMTFNESWGYTPIDNRWKDAWQIVGMLRQVAAGGGNLLLNIGPAPDGSVPEPCEQELLKVGRWLQEYGPSVYDATDPMQQEWMITGAFTRKGQTLYYHCNRWPGSELAIGGLQCKVLRARLMNGRELAFTQTENRLVLHGLPETSPNPICTVIEMEVEGEPKQVLGAGYVLL